MINDGNGRNPYWLYEKEKEAAYSRYCTRYVVARIPRDIYVRTVVRGLRETEKELCFTIQAKMMLYVRRESQCFNMQAPEASVEISQDFLWNKRINDQKQHRMYIL